MNHIDRLRSQGAIGKGDGRSAPVFLRERKEVEERVCLDRKLLSKVGRQKRFRRENIALGELDLVLVEVVMEGDGRRDPQARVPFVIEIENVLLQARQRARRLFAAERVGLALPVGGVHVEAYAGL